MRAGVAKCASAYGWEDGPTDDPLLLAAQLDFARLVERILEEEAPISSSRIEGTMQAAA